MEFIGLCVDRLLDMIMKKTTALVYHLGFILYFCSTLPAQDIQLQNADQIRTIKVGKFIDVKLSYPGLEPCSGCCNGARGQLISFADGVLKLKVYQSVEPIINGNKSVGSAVKSYQKTDYPLMSFNKDNILSITRKGNKRIKKFTPMQSVGITLTMLGAANLLAGAEVRDVSKDASNTLMEVGITEFVTGIILSSTFRQKTYITSPSCPSKRNKGKLWVIN